MVTFLTFRRCVPAAFALALLALAPAAAPAHDSGRCYPIWWHHHWVCIGAPGPTTPTPAPASTTAPADPAAPTTSEPAPGAPPAEEPTPTVLPSVSPSASSDVVSDPAPTAAAPPPVLGRTVAVAATAGAVTVRAPGGKSVSLSSAAALPTGTRIDTRAGEVALTSALDAKGATQTGRFSGGVFEVRQAEQGRGVTKVVMVGGHWRACGKGSSIRRAAVATKKKKARKPIRRLWGSDDHGRFQTQGSGSVATVRGTHWLTTDTCDGTRTTVLAGAVAVKSRVTGKTTVVRAGHTIFVRR